METETHATMEGTVVLYGVRSVTTVWKCFLWGPTPGYIRRVNTQPKVSQSRGQTELGS
jgi:hypothetical protein